MHAELARKVKAEKQRSSGLKEGILVHLHCEQSSSSAYREGESDGDDNFNLSCLGPGL
jgi:hypothetical protein